MPTLFINERSEFIQKEFGEYIVNDIEFVSAEGEVVIVQTFDESCPLQAGDIVRKLDGVDIKDVIQHCTEYYSVPMDGKICNALRYPLFRSHDTTLEVTVLRDGEEKTIDVPAGEFQVPSYLDMVPAIRRGRRNHTKSSKEILE